MDIITNRKITVRIYKIPQHKRDGLKRSDLFRWDYEQVYYYDDEVSLDFMSNKAAMKNYIDYMYYEKFSEYKELTPSDYHADELNVYDVVVFSYGANNVACLVLYDGVEILQGNWVL